VLYSPLHHHRRIWNAIHRTRVAQTPSEGRNVVFTTVLYSSSISNATRPRTASHFHACAVRAHESSATECNSKIVYLLPVLLGLARQAVCFQQTVAVSDLLQRVVVRNQFWQLVHVLCQSITGTGDVHSG
jgi:hypothetical protein